LHIYTVILVSKIAEIGNTVVELIVGGWRYRFWTQCSVTKNVNVKVPVY